MKKKSTIPITKVKNPEPNIKDDNWIIWAAWADRITFEEIKEKTGKSESEVIKIMRKNLKPSSFRLWRKRVHTKSIKNRKKFVEERKKLREKIVPQIFIGDTHVGGNDDLQALEREGKLNKLLNI